MSITGSPSIRRLKDRPVVMDLHEFAVVGRRATGGRDGRRLEWFAEVCENPTPRGRSHPGLRPLADVADRERSEGGPELVMGREDAVIPMP